MMAMASLKSIAPCLVLLTAVAGWPASRVRPQGPSAEARSHPEGRELYVRHCAPCHGLNGKGNGPAAAALKTTPPDLTEIQRPGARFPAGRVMDLVDGSKVVNAHGSRTMPVWGAVLRRGHGYSETQADLQSLVRYLESIQTHRGSN